MFSVSEKTAPVSDNTSLGAGSGSGGAGGGGGPDLTLPDDDTGIDPSLIDYLNDELASDEEDEMPDTSESDPWWEIFTNLWVIIGIGTFGVVSIGALLYLRTRAGRNGEPEAEKEHEPEPAEGT